MMKQKVLFFDIDGTLIWSYGGIREIPQGVQKSIISKSFSPSPKAYVSS